MNKSNIKTIIGYFSKQYLKKTGEPFIASWGRDGKIINELLSSFSEEKIIRCIDKYFDYDQKIYNIPFLKTNFNNLVQLLNDRPLKKKMINQDESRFL